MLTLLDISEIKDIQFTNQENVNKKWIEQFTGHMKKTKEVLKSWNRASHKRQH